MFMVKNKVIIHLAINVNRDYIGVTITALIYRIKVGRVGQLLVVAHHTDASPSLCYEPELIPDSLFLLCLHAGNGSGIS